MNETTQQNAQSSENLGASTQKPSTPTRQSSAEQGAQTSQKGIVSKISPLPTPPSSNDSGSFVERADKFFMALPKFADELFAHQ